MPRPSCRGSLSGREAPERSDSLTLGEIVSPSGRFPMPPDRSQPSTTDAWGSPPGKPAASARNGGGGRRAAISCGVIAAGLLVAIAWSEFHPTALAEAEAAYRRNDLESALRIAKGHLARRPIQPARGVARGAGASAGSAGPTRPSLTIRRPAPLDLEDRHIRAYALVLEQPPRAGDPGLIARSSSAGPTTSWP